MMFLNMGLFCEDLATENVEKFFPIAFQSSYSLKI